VMVHVINATAAGKTPDAIRSALEADPQEALAKVSAVLASWGPFEEVGLGSCRDASGNEYDAFKGGPGTLEQCKAGCLSFAFDQCRGFTFQEGLCELRMEEGFQEESNGWKLSISENEGRGSIQSASGGTARCWRRTDGPPETTTEEPFLPDLTKLLPGLPSLRDLLR
ncbi:unnamed protein product, partial [Effrenium voratum]